VILAADEFNPFPRRKVCTWIEQGAGLRVKVCDDGEVILWHDMVTGEAWLPSETPPAKWRSYFKQRQRQRKRRQQLHGYEEFGAATAPGVCPERPAHKPPAPLAKVRRLQNALRGLAKRVKDAAINTAADGLIGPRTVTATNRALKNYVPGFSSAPVLTRAEVLAQSPFLAARFDEAGRGTPAAPKPLPSSPFVAATQKVVQQYLPAATQDTTMPYPPQQQAYYQPPGYPQQPAYAPQGYGPPRGPGGLPTDRATLDVRAFIPAQYEHIRVSPGTGFAVIAVGVVVVFLLMRDKKHKKGD